MHTFHYHQFLCNVCDRVIEESILDFLCIKCEEIVYSSVTQKKHICVQGEKKKQKTFRRYPPVNVHESCLNQQESNDDDFIQE